MTPTQKKHKKPYLVIPRRLQINFEIPIQRLNLALILHLIHHPIGVFPPPLGAPVLPLNNLLGAGVALALEPVEDPFVEVVAPVQEGVADFGVSFAESVRKREC